MTARLAKEGMEDGGWRMEQRIALLESTVAELRGMIAQWVCDRQQLTLDQDNACTTVLRVVERCFHVSPSQMLGSARPQPVVLARWAAMWLLRSRFQLSQPAIGSLMRKDHTAVCYALKHMTDERDQNRRFSLALTAAERELDQMLQSTEQGAGSVEQGTNLGKENSREVRVASHHACSTLPAPRSTLPL